MALNLVCFPWPVQFPDAQLNRRPSTWPKARPFTPISARCGPPCGK